MIWRFTEEGEWIYWMLSYQAGGKEEDVVKEDMQMVGLTEGDVEDRGASR